MRRGKPRRIFRMYTKQKSGHETTRFVTIDY